MNEIASKYPNQWFSVTNVDALSVVVETTVLAKEEWPMQLSIYSSKELSEAAWTIRLISRALLLYRDQIIKLSPSYVPEKGDFPEIGEPAHGSGPRWAQNLHTELYRERPVMVLRDLEEFKTFFWDFNALMQPGSLRQAVRYFTRASDLAGVEAENPDYRNLDYRFVDYITSLETLVGEKDEASQKLALRAAVLVGGSPDDRQDTFDFIKAAYAIRSSAVHGAGVSDVMVRKGRTSLELGVLQDLDILHWYCRLSIRRVIDLLSAIRKSDPIAAKWNAIGKDEKNRWIQNLLDYCLVRNDLAEALEGFFNRTRNIESLWTEYEKISHIFGISGRLLRYDFESTGQSAG